jgi:putative ABC transport system permease protein
MTPKSPRPVRAAVTAFAILTALLPARFRHAFGPEMREAFEDEAVDRYRLAGTTGLTAVTCRALADVVISAWHTRVPAPGQAARAPGRGQRQRGTVMSALWQDLRYAIRTLRQQPGFTLVALLTLMVGIGANTAIFTIVNAALLRPLPYPHAERLVRIWGSRLEEPSLRMNINPLDAIDWAREAKALESVTVFTTTTQALTGAGDPVTVPVAFVTSTFFDTLGAHAARGAVFGPDHANPGRNSDVVVSHAFWMGALGGDSDMVGRSIELSDTACTIIGILPADFVSPGISAATEPQVWRPMVVAPDSSRGGHFARSIARLAPGATVAQAQAQVDAVMTRLAREFPSTNHAQWTFIEPLQDAISGDARTPALMLMAAVAVVLLIGCANVANLLLARASTRQREMAVRSALGAGRGRIVRQLMTESLALGTIGGLCGVALGAAAIAAIPTWLTGQVPLAIAAVIDGRVLAFTLILSVGTAVLFGLVPALHGSRSDIRSVLTSGGDSRATGSGRIQSLLLVVETALALVLLVAATLLVQSLMRLQFVNPGFDTEHVLTFRVSLPRARYPETARRVTFFNDLSERLQRLPGVSAAGGVNMSPLTDRYSCDSFGLADRPAPPEGQEPCAEARVATPDYFTAMGISLVKGRSFEPGDRESTPPVIIINETMARKYWPGGNGLGQRFKWGSVSSDDPWRTVVGIVRDVKHFALDAEAYSEVYVPVAQSGTTVMTLAVRTTRDPQTLPVEIRTAVSALDPLLPISEVFTTRQLVQRSTAMQTFRTQLLTAFALVALGLAIVGVYGVMAFFVAQRSQEIGIRMALGASPAAVRRMVIGRGIKAAILGAVLGLIVSIPVTRLIGGLLFGVTPGDPIAYALGPALLVSTALLASYLPARRAARIDPIRTIKAQ